VKVQAARWGNSMGMRLPKSVVDELGIVAGAQLDLVVEGKEIRIRPLRKTSRQLLEAMVAEARLLGPDHEPDTIDWGPDRGSEMLDDGDPR
jgi:antitoxin MazE